MKKIIATLACALLFAGSLTVAAFSEEGMWTFDNLPIKELKEKYNFTPSQQWLDNVRLSSVRFNNGGSGSFVSKTGLVLTNQHVARTLLQKMSSKNNDYVKNGFYAINEKDEIKCADLELNVLVNMKDVTKQVEKSFEGLTGETAVKARKAAIAKIEKENLDKTGMRSDVVALYQGGEYWLYTYKKYRDVRLVMAPEDRIASFGGKFDNFTYPRYELDFTIFRVYENDKPVVSKNFMKINTNGIKPEELVFVTGHPGTTKRANTYAQYLFNRDHVYPANLESRDKTIKALEDYSKRGKEEARIALTPIARNENGFKAYTGEYAGLANSEFSAKFEQQEKKLKALINSNPEIKKEVGSAFEDIEKALKIYSGRYDEIFFSSMKSSTLTDFAISIVTYTTEITKPDGERQEGYHDSQIDTWKYKILSPAPIYKGLEEVLFANSLQMILDKLGKDHKVSKIMLNGKTPKERAKELISSSKLTDAAYRKSLIDGGVNAVNKSDDPLIQLALKMEPHYSEIKKWQESEIEPLITPSKEKIASAKFKIYGKNVYPDATFTLRLSYGTVKGYPMNGTIAPCFTTFYGLYDRAHSFQGQEEWQPPSIYLKYEKDIELSTPLNFVSTNDIIGGNSGSPVINRKAEVVGLVFDGNIESLAGRFIFDGTANRAVSVHMGGIVEVLKKVYKADKLVEELLEQ